jgi:predicted transposase YdaD
VSLPPPFSHHRFLDEKDILWFDYLSVELAEIPVEDLKEMGLMGLLPLAVLTKGGANRSVFREVVTQLGEARQSNLLVISRLFAGLVFTEEEDRKWLERIFAMQNNPLAESWTYQQILNEGIEQGIEKGIEQGIEKGREEGIEQGVEKGKLEGLREAVLNVVEARFPPLVELARQRVPHARTTDTVNLVLKGVATAPDENAARFVLDLLAA